MKAVAACALLLGLSFGTASAQIIEFESAGLKYKAQTHGGVTVMYAHLPLQVREYAVLQIAVSNGSPISWSIKPEDFRFEPENGTAHQAQAARAVIGNLLAKASRGDVSKLVSAYEAALYGNAQMHSTNGYETRRQDAMAEIGSSKLKAAAAASAIALVPTKLAPGQSTDGAVFYSNGGKPLPPGRLVLDLAGETFVFPIATEVRAMHARVR